MLKKMFVRLWYHKSAVFQDQCKGNVKKKIVIFLSFAENSDHSEATFYAS